jgi:Zinc carboxypeptidase
MHGDEVVGRELLLRFIDYLLVAYAEGKAAITNNAEPSLDAKRIIRLIDETVIYIIPSMNPDGFEMHTRENGSFFCCVLCVCVCFVVFSLMRFLLCVFFDGFLTLFFQQTEWI